MTKEERRKVISQTLQVTLGCLLACSVSSVPLDAGYGVPAAPLILAPHQPAALPLQLLHAAPQPVPLPLIHNHAQPIFHSAPEPLIHPLPAPAPFVPAPLPLFQEPQLLAPAPLPVPIQAPSSQFHAQDEFGQFSFGYENINSAKTETKDAFGVTRGSYQYIDANGIVQTVNYIADDVNGFRVAGTNIPTAPAALPIGPAPVAETPEVAAARAAHLAAHDQALAAAADATEERKKRSPEEESEPTPEPEPEPEPEAERKKREAEPINADYKIPAAPVLVSPPVVHAAPVAVSAPVHLPQPAPLLHHAPLHPAPFVQAALPHVPAHPFPVPQPSALPFIPAPQPFPEPIFAPAPQPIAFAPEPIALAPEPLRFAPEFIGPAPLPAPLAAPSSQFHAQDEFGQFSFGYENINSAKTETKDAFGVTRGSYQYVDANGIVQTVNYIADDINGFRVAGTNIPVAVAGAQPVAPAALPLVAPVPVLETPEVAAARAEHLAAHAEAKAAVDAANAKEEEL